MNRSRAAWSLLAAGMTLAGLACGPRRAGTPSPPGEDLVVLLPDRTTGAVGQIVVSNASGSALKFRAFFILSIVLYTNQYLL